MAWPKKTSVKTGVASKTVKKPAVVKPKRAAPAGAKRWQGQASAAQRHLAEQVMAVLASDFEKHGGNTVAKLRDESPANYLRLVAGLMPRETPDENLLERVSDAELVAAIAQLRALAASAGAAGGGSRTAKKPEQAQELPALQ